MEQECGQMRGPLRVLPAPMEPKSFGARELTNACAAL